MYESIIKRCLDISLSFCALIVLSPILLITAIAIKISSPGPALYYSERITKNHRVFKFYKFRSMHIVEKDKGLFIADRDRLFKIGQIIRRTKIDELPQLLNVIKGDMSIVGPRPMPCGTVDLMYGGKYQEVLSVKAGLTSAASLYDYTVGDTINDDEKYRSEIVPVKQELELYYVQNRSFKYDFELVCRTIIIILQVFLGKKKFSIQSEIGKLNKR